MRKVLIKRGNRRLPVKIHICRALVIILIPDFVHIATGKEGPIITDTSPVGIHLGFAHPFTTRDGKPLFKELCKLPKSHEYLQIYNIDTRESTSNTSYIRASDIDKLEYGHAPKYFILNVP